MNPMIKIKLVTPLQTKFTNSLLNALGMNYHSVSFVPSPFYNNGTTKNNLSTKCRPLQRNFRSVPISMSSRLGKVSLYAGSVAISGILFNRLFLTPIDSLALSQSRSDILGVISASALVLYGVGKADIADRTAAAAKLSGEDVVEGFDDKSDQIKWSMDALLGGSPFVQSVALISRTKTQFSDAFVGKFRTRGRTINVRSGGIIDVALNKGEMAYLADLKVVPTKELDFGFLPKDCQAVIVQPVGKEAVLVLGADRPRPFTGIDFGWLQALTNQIVMLLEQNQHV